MNNSKNHKVSIKLLWCVLVIIVLSVISFLLLITLSKPKNKNHDNNVGTSSELVTPYEMETKVSVTDNDAISQTTTVTPTPTKPRTAMPEISITPTPTPNGLFYFNDFSLNDDNLSDWVIHMLPFYYRHDHNPNKYIFEKNNNEYSLNSLVPNPVYLIYDISLPEADQIFSMDMTFVGQDEARVGLICRYSTTGWYELSINNQGNWRIDKIENFVNETTIVNTVLADGVTEINAGIRNHISISCKNDKLSLFLNDEELGSVSDLSQNGTITGLVYEEKPSENSSLLFGNLKYSSPNPSETSFSDTDYLNYDFHLWQFSGSINNPENIQALQDNSSTISIEENQAKIVTNRPMNLIALYPVDLPQNIEFSIDVNLSKNSNDDYSQQGFGLVCKWDDHHNSITEASTGGYVMWIQQSMVIVTPYTIDGFGNIHSVGAVEFSDDRHFIDLLKETHHHMMARCWGDKIEFYIDDILVANYKTTDFRGAGNRKHGLMAGIMFSSVDSTNPVWIDNLKISWGLP